MVIDLGELKKFLQNFFSSLEKQNINSVDIGDKNLFWVCDWPEWTDITKTPIPDVGSFVDDYEIIEKTNKGDYASIADVDKVANILRIIQLTLLNMK